MAYNGGSVETAPAVYLVFWGSQWTDPSVTDGNGFTNVQAFNYIKGFFSNVGGSSWLAVTTQYCQNVPLGATSCAAAAAGDMITNPAGIVKGYFVDTVDPLPSGPVTDDDVRNEVNTVWATHFNFDSNAMYFVFTPYGVQWSTPPPVPFFTQPPPNCAWHDAIVTGAQPIPYAFVPYVADPVQNITCYANEVNNVGTGGETAFNGNGTFDAFSIVAGHEYAETVTDPTPNGDPRFNGNPGWFTGSVVPEIGDKCDHSSSGPVKTYPVPYANITLGGQPYAVQGLWSNQASGCVLGLPAPWPGPVADPVVAEFNGDLQVFARSTDPATNGHLITGWCRQCDGSDWHFGDLGGVITGRPSVLAYNGQLQVFADGSDGQTLFHKWYDNSFGWHDWQAIACCGAAPATAVFNNDLQVFARDTGTGHLITTWCAACDGSDWHFGDLGGVITGTPTVLSYGGQLQVFADGSDARTLFHRWFENGFGWHDWQTIACCGADPATAIYHGVLELFARDTGTGHLITAICTACNGSDWQFGDLGGVITGAPSLVSYPGRDQLQAIADGSTMRSSTDGGTPASAGATGRPSPAARTRQPLSPIPVWATTSGIPAAGSSSSPRAPTPAIWPTWYTRGAMSATAATGNSRISPDHGERPHGHLRLLAHPLP